MSTGSIQHEAPLGAIGGSTIATHAARFHIGSLVSFGGTTCLLMGVMVFGYVRAFPEPPGDGARSVARSSAFSTRSRADIGNDPDLVRAKLKRQAAGKKTKIGAAKPAGTRNHTKDRGGKRGSKGHQFKYDGYGGQVTL